MGIERSICCSWNSQYKFTGNRFPKSERAGWSGRTGSSDRFIRLQDFGDLAHRAQGHGGQTRNSGNLQRWWRGNFNGGGTPLIRIFGLVALAVFIMVSSASAEDTLRVCIYGSNLGSNEVHRAVLKEAKRLNPRIFLIDGDILNYEYGQSRDIGSGSSGLS